MSQPSTWIAGSRHCPQSVLSGHAQLRQVQRNYTNNEISYILRHGRMIRRTGICFYFLAAKDVPRDERRLEWVQRLIGSTVLVNAEGSDIITLYKNRHALHDIKKKVKFRVRRIRQH